MEIQKKFIKFLTFVVILIMCFQTRVLAITLKISVTTDRDSYKIGEIIDVTVEWKEKMQATSFKIGYDSEKLEFISASINKSFYNSSNDGEISVNWASLDETDLTQMKFQFKALKNGKADVRIKEDLSFADGNLVSPTSYDISTSGIKTIKIESEETGKTEDKEGKNENYKKQGDQENYKSQEKKEDNTLAQNAIPKTGIQGDILLIIIVVGILAVIFFIKNKKYSRL